jgi:hypothetical protein
MGMPTRDESVLNRTLAPTNKAPIKKKLLMVVASNGELLIAVGKTGTLYADCPPLCGLIVHRFAVFYGCCAVFKQLSQGGRGTKKRGNEWQSMSFFRGRASRRQQVGTDPGKGPE